MPGSAVRGAFAENKIDRMLATVGQGKVFSSWIGRMDLGGLREELTAVTGYSRCFMHLCRWFRENTILHIPRSLNVSF